MPLAVLMNIYAKLIENSAAVIPNGISLNHMGTPLVREYHATSRTLDTDCPKLNLVVPWSRSDDVMRDGLERDPFSIWEWTFP